ncbi:hypothetical protein Tsubulata_030494, partial [Turnera subulata]
TSWVESWARHFVTKFLGRFISTGCLILQEEGGETLIFQGINTIKCSLRVILRIHDPQFYWKVMTRGDVGLADAYIDGDFSLVDKNEGLLNFFVVRCALCMSTNNELMLLIANTDASKSITKVKTARGWWTPLFSTAVIKSSKLFLKHVMRQNSLTQARRNISRHYDLGNEVFELFMDETMTYSCALFKEEDEDLKVAQRRKISVLIEKARIESKHEVLEIGCGWGSFAIEVVKQTGCKYTGITLSKEQLKFAEAKTKEAGLQDRIRFLLCDYRELPDTKKYDRIIAWQFTSVAEEEYDELRRSSGFLREYIFPGGLVPSLSRFIRTSEYYFDYSAAGINSYKFPNYQEEGGETFTFQGISTTKCSLQVILRVHNPQFYWKLLNANGDANKSITEVKKTRGWWSPMFSTALISSSKLFFKHVMRQNSLTQARRNISRHYDLEGEEEEDLRVAQHRKISVLIGKARIECKHEVLDIGCGWGTFAIEVVKQTGCKYTGITLSKEQLNFAELKVKDAGLQSMLDTNTWRCFLAAVSRYWQKMGFLYYSVEHVENIGPHYYHTLRCWRKKFLKNQSKIVAMGFDEKFFRTWEYYFDYSAAGFMSGMLGNYQVKKADISCS